MAQQPSIYILANPYRTLYIGVTGNLEQRLWQHRQGIEQSWAKRYDLKSLVYFELYPDMPSAIARETQLKKWNRAKKLKLIETLNPRWNDLSAHWQKTADRFLHFDRKDEYRLTIRPQNTILSFRPKPSPSSAISHPIHPRRSGGIGP